MVVVLEVVDVDGDVVVDVFDAGRPVVGVVAGLAVGLPAGTVFGGAVGCGVVVPPPAGVAGVVDPSAWPGGAVACSASLA